MTAAPACAPASRRLLAITSSKESRTKLQTGEVRSRLPSVQPIVGVQEERTPLRGSTLGSGEGGGKRHAAAAARQQPHWWWVRLACQQTHPLSLSAVSAIDGMTRPGADASVTWGSSRSHYLQQVSVPPYPLSPGAVSSAAESPDGSCHRWQHHRGQL